MLCLLIAGQWALDMRDAGVYSEFCCGAAAAVVTVAIAMTWRPLSHSNDGGGRCHTAMIVRGSGFDARSARVRHTRTSA